MSHFTTIKTSMIELEYIKKGLTDLGYPFQEGNVTVRGFAGGKTTADLKVAANRRYDIGFRKTNQNYEIVADWWGIRKIKQEAFSQQLTQRYAYHATVAKLEEQGFTLTEELQQQNGGIHLTLRRVI